MKSRLAGTFGGNLRRYRHEAGFTQEQLSERVAITPEYLSNLERGVATPSFSLMDRLAGAVNRPAADLLEPRGVGSRWSAKADAVPAGTAAGCRDPTSLILRAVDELEEIVGICRMDDPEDLYISPSFEKVTGYNRELVIRDQTRFLQTVHEDDREAVTELMRQVRAPGTRAAECRIVRTDGSVRLVRIRGKTCTDGLFVGIAVDITEERRATDSFEQLSRYISHEVRNAATVVNGSLRPLIMAMDDEAIRRRLQLAMGALNELTGLTDDVLAGSDNGWPEAHTVPVDLQPIATEIVERFQPLALEKDLEIFSEGHGCVVMADPVRLGHVLVNLVGNAVKYTDSGFIRVRWENLPDGYAEISVIDSGPGIEQTRLSEMLTSDTAPATPLGHGLGLHIAGSLTRSMGGTLVGRSVVGNGTTVTVRLIQAPPETGKRRTAGPAEDRAASAASAAPAVAPHIPPKKILVVEDTTITMIWLRSVLRDAGHTVIPVMDGAAAQKALRDARPDLAIIDMHLPDGDGIELAQRLKACGALQDVPVIFTSALVDKRLRSHVRRMHHSAIIAKPFEPELLHQTMADLLAAKG
jgi:PAS domain S-box-containing protein